MLGQGWYLLAQALEGQIHGVEGIGLAGQDGEFHYLVEGLGQGALGLVVEAVALVAGPSSWATLMRFWMRVPVLSTHRTVAAPRLSTAGRRLVSSFFWAMRQAPRARKYG